MQKKKFTASKLVGKPEVSVASGVRHKDAKADKVKDDKVKTLRGKHWLRLFVAGVVLSDMTWGMIGIYSGLGGPEHVAAMTNAMWIYGVTHALAVALLFAVKLE